MFNLHVAMWMAFVLGIANIGVRLFDILNAPYASERLAAFIAFGLYLYITIAFGQALL